MDKDLEKIQEEIRLKDLAQRGEVSGDSGAIVETVGPGVVPQVDFSPAQPVQAVEGDLIKKSSDEVGGVVTQIFKQAVVATVQNDDEVKQGIIDTAKNVITNKTDSLKFQAEKESKAAFFDNNQDACQYFGYDEKTTSKALVKIMAVWAFILNSIYIFTIGFFIVSPITFICKKIRVVIKVAWVAVIMAILIYGLVIGLPILFTFLGTL